ncbi:MAG: mandelate racemase/muconate lactonizing enzyme family protein [Acidobacteriaceae bacterium]|nr:mandelate racemase/muconate lactonizing enzyme family protein [Acidobacteriaceae bacterium]
MVHRRKFLSSVAGALGLAFWDDKTLEATTAYVNANSKPSELKITDLRVTTIKGAPMTDPIIRIDTNQGIYGLGEVRDGASKTYALMLKSRILGENPCNIDRVFRKIKQFGGESRQAGGVCAIEMALWDVAGKAYNVPVYQMLGGKFRDKIRCYADTTESDDPHIYGDRLKKRKEQGFTWLKMDLGIDLMKNMPGTITRPEGVSIMQGANTPHMFTGIELTPKGIETMTNFVAVVRDYVGYDVPLSCDHFGHIGVNSCIRLGKALEQYNVAWLEDMIPWQFTDLLKEIKQSVNIPLCTGEDIYLKEGFVKLAQDHAVDILHPDLATAGGILETKKIGDAIEECGIPMAMHFAGSPVSCMANVHCAAATNNFLVLENHSVDVPWWSDLVEGVEKPIVNHGFITVPDNPGLGVTLNEDVIKQHLLEPGYFEPTPEWDKEHSHDRLWSMRVKARRSLVV